MLFFFLAPQNTFLTGFKKFKTMLLDSSTGLPNSVMSHLFSVLCTGSQLRERRKKKKDSFQTRFTLLWLSEWFCPYLPLRSSSPLHSFSAALFFCRYLSVQNIILSQKIKWSALFLLPSSNNMEQTPRFYPSRILCQFLQIFLENLSPFKNFFFIPPALRCLCVSWCVWGVCVSASMCLLLVYLNFWRPNIYMC